MGDTNITPSSMWGNFELATLSCCDLLLQYGTVLCENQLSTPLLTPKVHSTRWSNTPPGVWRSSLLIYCIPYWASLHPLAGIYHSPIWDDSCCCTRSLWLMESSSSGIPHPLLGCLLSSSSHLLLRWSCSSFVHLYPLVRVSIRGLISPSLHPT